MTDSAFFIFAFLAFFLAEVNSVTPRRSATHGSSVVIGTSAGRGGTIVWPNAAAMR